MESSCCKGDETFRQSPLQHEDSTVLTDFGKFAENLPAGAWIYTTTNLSRAVIYELDRYDLDQLAPDNPFYAKVGNAWYGLVNTAMLDILIETYGENLPGILKDDQGVPNGRLFGIASWSRS